MSRRVILFVDNNEIKVVTGSMVISTPLDQVGLPHKKQYFDNLFATSEVVWVTGLEILSRDVFYGMIGVPVQAPPPAVAMPVSQPQQVLQPMAPQVAMMQPRMAAPQVQQPQQVQQYDQQQFPRTVIAGPPQQQQQQQQKKRVFEDGNKWVVAESEAAIIVDDLPTGGQVRNSGRPATLALIPGKPVNLARFDSETIRKSSILKSLARAGIVKPISSDVAHRMLEKFEAGQDNAISAKEVAAYEGPQRGEHDFIEGRQRGSDAVVIDLDDESRYQDSEVDSMRQIMHEIDLSEEQRMIQREESLSENPLAGSPPIMERPRARLNRSGVGQRAQTRQAEQYSESDDIEMLQ
jgi:hypothetical protein